MQKCELGEHEIEVTKHLIESGIDGVVLPPPLCEAGAVLKLLADARVPAVSVGRRLPSETVLAIKIDDREAALVMTRHIIALSHRCIGFLTGNPNLSASALRFKGYKQALHEAGVAVDETLVAHGLYTYRSGLDAAERLLGLADPRTAIFSSDDDMAAATVAVAHHHGLDVPSDLTVCGFDDTTLSTAIWPELTTVHQPIADMARAAVELLVSDVRKTKGVEPFDRHQLLDFTFTRRQS